MAKNDTTLLIVGAALVAGFVLYKKGLIKIPGMSQVQPTLSQTLANNNLPALPPISQMTIDNPNISPPIQITAPSITGNSIDLGF